MIAHYIALHCIRVKWQAQYGLLSFLSGFKWIASHYFCEFHFSSVFSSYQCVSTHIEIAKRKGHCATRQQFNTMNGVCGVVFTDMFNNKGMATTTSAAQRQQPTNQPTNENWFSVCAQGTSYYLTLAQNSIAVVENVMMLVTDLIFSYSIRFVCVCVCLFLIDN